MATVVAVSSNYAEYQIRGEIDLSAAAAVLAVRGDNLTCTKTATGTYTVVMKGAGTVKLVELLRRAVTFTGATNPATALGCKITTVTQATDGSDDVTITIKTLASPTSGADTDGTAAVTLSFEVVFRMNKMGNPL